MNSLLGGVTLLLFSVYLQDTKRQNPNNKNKNNNNNENQQKQITDKKQLRGFPQCLLGEPAAVAERVCCRLAVPHLAELSRVVSLYLRSVEWISRFTATVFCFGVLILLLQRVYCVFISV